MVSGNTIIGAFQLNNEDGMFNFLGARMYCSYFPGIHVCEDEQNQHKPTFIDSDEETQVTWHSCSKEGRQYQFTFQDIDDDMVISQFVVIEPDGTRSIFDGFDDMVDVITCPAEMRYQVAMHIIRFESEFHITSFPILSWEDVENGKDEQD